MNALRIAFGSTVVSLGQVASSAIATFHDAARPGPDNRPAQLVKAASCCAPQDKTDAPLAGHRYHVWTPDPMSARTQQYDRGTPSQSLSESKLRSLKISVVTEPRTRLVPLLRKLDDFGHLIERRVICVDLVPGEAILEGPSTQNLRSLAETHTFETVFGATSLRYRT